MSEDLIDIPLTLESLLVKFLGFLPSIIAAIVVFLIGVILSMFISRAVRIALERRKVKPGAVTALVRITNISLVTLTLVITLQQIGFNLTAFLTGLGILGFTVGFALQDVSKNFVAGLLLLIQQPFRVGETIEVDTFIGEVLEIDMRATKILALDGRIILIPNAEVFTNPLINYSQAELRRIEIPAGVSGDSDLNFVRQTAIDAIKDLPGLVLDPAPQVLFHTFGDYSIDLTIYFWIDPLITNPPGAKDFAIEALNTAFINQKIELPSPAQTILVGSS